MYGELTESIESWGGNSIQKTGTSGKCYIIFSPKAGERAFVHVKSKRTREGITTYTVTSSKDSDSSKELVVKDEPCDSTLHGSVWHAGDDLVFIPVTADKYGYGPKEGAQPGDAMTLDKFLYSNNMLPAELHTSEKSAGTRYELSFNGRTTTDMDDRQMAIKLASTMKISGEQALDLLDAVDLSGSTKFWMQREELEKSGGMRLTEQPDFQNEYDSEFNVPVDNGHGYRLDVDQQQEPFPGQRLGDSQQVEGGQYDNSQGLSKEQLLSETPEALAQLAQVHQLPNLFEHGVVGALTNTFDAVAMIDKYVPDLEKALDAIGRCLFLFFWKPGEFQDAYGLDDMQNLEDELLSTFKVMGDLTLSLLKKAPKSNVTMAGGSSGGNASSM